MNRIDSRKYNNNVNDKQLILVVDDTPLNLAVLTGMLEDQYTILTACNGEEALAVVEQTPPDLILLDIMMPGLSGYEVCRILKSRAETADIPVIFVSALTEASDERLGFDAGAVDYVTKPVKIDLVRARVKSHLALANQQLACRQMVEVRTRELEQTQRAAIVMLGEAGHYNDSDTGVHIWRMGAYAGALARALSWPIEDSERLELAASMHDTGKIGIPDSILKAARKLTEEEWEIMKTHAEIGYQILSESDTPIFQVAAEVAHYHHEKWDGSGYPEKLVGEAIPESARIVAIADVFDALTMDRPYKKAWTSEQAIELLKKDAGSHFDPRLMDVFISILPEILEIKAYWANKESPLE
ncbi:MAG: response regulator [Gammaproteobacteria bacterium]|nr:response regulator [Gammaproteobacteria bacterium]